MAWPLVAGAAIGAIGGLMSRDKNKTLTSGGTTGGQTQSTYTPPSYLRPAYGFLAGNAQQLMQRPVPFFPGVTYVGPSAATQRGVGYGMQGVQSMLPLLATQNRNYSFLSNAADVANNPYVQAQIAANRGEVNQALSEDWLPTATRGAMSVNALGSTRQGVMQAQAMERAANQLSRTNARTMLDAYGQGLGAQQYALGQTGAVLGNQMAPSEALMGLGGTIEDYQGRALQDAMRRYAYQFQEPQERMQMLMGTLGALQPLGTQYGTNYSANQSTGANPNYQSAMQAGLGGALKGMSFGSMFQK